jgi:AcrR family transcriptional regulator
MSPKPADPKVRMALLETAAELIAAEGAASLTLRKLATKVGTSTMAVYTHFGGMDELRREVRREGFNRLRDHLSAVPRTDDPIADIGQLGVAYYVNGVTNPHLYRAMFMEGPAGDDDTAIGLDTFVQLVEAVRRGIDTGAFAPGDAFGMAQQLWAVAHGVVALQLAHLMEPEVAQKTLRDAAAAVMRGFEAAGVGGPAVQ